ncbi:MAG: hypothetical protein ACJAX5_001974 [Patiriisocius sp.]|jgi:hypothetical protein
MSAPQWSEEDRQIEQEFAEVISIFQEQISQQQNPPESVPRRLDRQIKRLAKVNALDDIDKNWILSNGARLTLVVLLFFSIAMIWLLL